MKKILIILWLIIILGATFIAIEIFAPKHEGSDEISRETTLSGEETKPEKTKRNYSEYVEYGDKYLAEEDYKNAIVNYQAAANTDPNEKILIKLGDTYLKNNQPDKAKETFLQAREKNKESIKISLGIIKSMLNLKEIEGAKNLLWQLDETDYQVKYYKAIVLILYKSFDESKTLFEEIIANKSLPQELTSNAQKFLDKYETFGYFRESEQVFLETLLAKAMTEVDEYGSAIPILFDVITQKNNYRDAWLILGYAYLNTGNYTDAIDALNKAETLDSQKSETLFYLGLAYFADNNIEKAIYYLDKSDKKGFPLKDQINLKLGELFTIKGDYKNAAKKYEKVLTINTSNLEVFTKLVVLYIDKLNEPGKALTISEKAIENFKDDAMSYNLKGWALTALNRYTEAKEYLYKALEMDKSLSSINLNIGWLYEKQGMMELAKEYYKKAGDIALMRLNNLNKSIEANKDQYNNYNISKP